MEDVTAQPTGLSLAQERVEQKSPYLIDGPALVSFSGGRTSAYMLHEIIKAHGGSLPDGIKVAFANTGKEREETLRFVHECGSRWGVKVHWLEWRDGKPGFEEVGFNSASRRGEPFKALIDKKQRLPNWMERWCTSHLKVKPMHALMLETLGLVPGQFAEVIGLRDDEGIRIFDGLERAEKEGRTVLYPLAKAKVRKADVMAFWHAAPFDLGIPSWKGNCDDCFLKSRAVRKRSIRDDPLGACWWIEREFDQDGFFDRRDSYLGLLEEVARQPDLIDEIDDEHDVECGNACAEDAE